MQVLALETISLDQLDGFLGYGFGGDDLIKPHEPLGKFQPVHVLGHAEQVHFFSTCVPITAQSFEDASAKFESS